ncbi:hypothetical protein [Acinetobacter genomosp. 15BJ]|uniref:Uncharacterized protein n=1 Tax=Acinetobacter genomosp. 15BJ TaxID=106651 RepID=A0ABT8V4S6_9GAMM|nr:hypothetical protein [Acinetobacter genomosp. 15BJ]MDO3659161.1 hypothetical protein [Acinetobacter genomosp. 15BJ]
MATAPRLTKEKIDIALSLLDSWVGKLTWDRFLALLELDVGHKYTKAALLRHPKFKKNWDSKRWIKNDESDVNNSYGFKGLNSALAKIDKLENTIERLEKENNLLIEKFVVWATNAANKGITLDELNKPIPTNSNKEFR